MKSRYWKHNGFSLFLFFNIFLCFICSLQSCLFSLSVLFYLDLSLWPHSPLLSIHYTFTSLFYICFRKWDEIFNNVACLIAVLFKRLSMFGCIPINLIIITISLLIILKRPSLSDYQLFCFDPVPSNVVA